MVDDLDEEDLFSRVGIYSSSDEEELRELGRERESAKDQREINSGPSKQRSCLWKTSLIDDISCLLNNTNYDPLPPSQHATYGLAVAGACLALALQTRPIVLLLLGILIGWSMQRVSNFDDVIYFWFPLSTTLPTVWMPAHITSFHLFHDTLTDLKTCLEGLKEDYGRLISLLTHFKTIGLGVQLSYSPPMPPISRIEANGVARGADSLECLHSLPMIRRSVHRSLRSAIQTLDGIIKEVGDDNSPPLTSLSLLSQLIELQQRFTSKCDTLDTHLHTKCTQAINQVHSLRDSANTFTQFHSLIHTRLLQELRREAWRMHDVMRRQLDSTSSTLTPSSLTADMKRLLKMCDCVATAREEHDLQSIHLYELHKSVHALLVKSCARSDISELSALVDDLTRSGEQLGVKFQPLKDECSQIVEELGGHSAHEPFSATNAEVSLSTTFESAPMESLASCDDKEDSNIMEVISAMSETKEHRSVESGETTRESRVEVKSVLGELQSVLNARDPVPMKKRGLPGAAPIEELSEETQMRSPTISKPDRTQPIANLPSFLTGDIARALQSRVTTSDEETFE